MTGAKIATRKKKITTPAETTPVRSRRKRSHISRPGERPTVSGVFAASFSPVVVAAGAGMVIVREPPTSMAERDPWNHRKTGGGKSMVQSVLVFLLCNFHLFVAAIPLTAWGGGMKHLIGLETDFHGFVTLS
ncbi:hypothetical protein GCM10010517_42870 [Streptosporangium fragile]|uniref:Uncharacterized protein n=1 Tax=Streptosporangium fragile TaxID=46186 RepID=A0ABN3W0S7_9ACTN